MFSSRTLADRNNDPHPVVSYAKNGVMLQRQSIPLLVFKTDRWEPRPEFQHGVLPENPILTLLRGLRSQTSVHSKLPWARELDWLENNLKFPTGWTLPQITHAHRVLTLLSKIGANQ